jgi:UDP:flavonoid glycosyltransferase YjiC (YdhE family)
MPLPKEPRLFAYLGIEHRVTAKLLAALKASDLPAEAYVRGLTEETAKKYLRPGLTFYRSPQPIGQVLARATLAIHHGGSGMSLACCSAGRPQIALPVHEETLLNAQALGRIGVGGSITHKDLETVGAARLAEAEADPRRRERAAVIAAEIAAAGPFRPLDHILDTCRAALGNA